MSGCWPSPEGQIRLEKPSFIFSFQGFLKGLQFLCFVADIGGWGNTKSVIRPCNSETGEQRCKAVQVKHEEKDIVVVDEFRPFWIEYKEGVVKVGKGGQEEAFLEWDVGASLQQVPVRVQIGIASYHIAQSEFVFFQHC